MKPAKSKFAIAMVGGLLLASTSQAQNVTVNGKDTGVNAEDAIEAFKRLGEAMKEAA